jgi:hypothetical protein
MKFEEKSFQGLSEDINKNLLEQYQLARKIKASLLRARNRQNLALGGNIYDTEIHQCHRWPTRSSDLKWDIHIDYNTKEQNLLLAVIEEKNLTDPSNSNGLAWNYNLEKGTLTDLINNQGVVGMVDPIETEGKGVISCLFEAWIGGQVIIASLTIGGKRIFLPAHAFRENETLAFLTGSSMEIKKYPLFETIRFAMNPSETMPSPEEIMLPINEVQTQVLEGLASIRLTHGAVHKPLMEPIESVFTKTPAMSQPTRLINTEKIGIFSPEEQAQKRKLRVLWQENNNPFLE